MRKYEREEKSHKVFAEIKKLLAEGMSKADISRKLGIASSTVSFHAKNMGLSKPRPFYNWEEVHKAFDEGFTEKEVIAKFRMSARTIWEAKKDGRLVIDKAKRVERKIVKKRSFKHSKIEAWLEDFVASFSLPRERKEECIFWPFSKSKSGHGQIIFHNDGKKTCKIVSRIVCEKFHGPAPKGKPFAMHNCKGGNACIEPTHLNWSTTIKTPSRDFIEKISGSKHSRSMFSDEQVLALRREYKEKPFVISKRAKTLNCGKSTLRKILIGETYNYLPDAIVPVRLPRVNEIRVKVSKPRSKKIAVPDELKYKAKRYKQMGFPVKIVAKRLQLPVKLVTNL